MASYGSTAAVQNMRDRLEDFASEFESMCEEGDDSHSSADYAANTTSSIKVNQLTGDHDRAPAVEASQEQTQSNALGGEHDKGKHPERTQKNCT